MPAYIRIIENLFETGQLTWDSPITELPYIGLYLAARLQDVGIFYLRDVITELINTVGLDAPAELIFNTVAGWVTNARAHSCVNNYYLPRHFNRMGFNSIIDLVAYANAPEISVLPVDLLEQGICQFNENHAGLAADGLEPGRPLCAKLLSYGNVGLEPAIKAMRVCPCKTTEDTCAPNPLCRWVPAPGGGACLSRVSSSNRRNFVRDVAPYSGDWQPVARPTRPQTRRVVDADGWWYALGEAPGPASPGPASPGPASPGPVTPPQRSPPRRSARLAQRNLRRSDRLKKQERRP